MIPHRLVEIHAVKDWSIESGEQLLRYDQDLRFLIGLVKLLSNLLLFVIREVKLLQGLGIFLPTAIDDDLGVVSGQELIQCFLVEDASLPVDRYEEGLVPHRFNALLEVVRDETGYLVHPVAVLEHVPQCNCPLKDLVHLLDVAHALQLFQIQKFPLKDFSIYL